MFKVKLFFSSLIVAFFLLCSPGVNIASTTTSGGQAIIPPFSVHYFTTSHSVSFTTTISNISNYTVNVVIEYYKQSGDVAKTVEVDIDPRETVVDIFDGSATPNVQMDCYGVIKWSGPATLQKPLVASGVSNYYYQTSSFRNFDRFGIPVNFGMPF